MRAQSFLCLVPGRGDPARLPTASLREAEEKLGLERLIDSPRLLFLGAPGSRKTMLPAGLGLIWGSLFDAANEEIREIGTTQANTWIGSNGADLIGRAWGGYLAILDKGTTWIVVRDPSGGIPCYMCSFEGGTLLASDADLAARSGLLPGRFDWGEVASQLVYFSRRSACTAIEGLRELLPGCALDLGAAEPQTRLLWSPHAFAVRERRITDFSRAVPLVRATVGSTVAAWANLFEAPLVELSGGLDSSIVAACMAKAGAHATCFTFRGGGADLDETCYARAVADRARLPLVDETLALSRIDLLDSAAAHLPRPTARSFSAAGDRQSLALARRRNADAFFTGAGGDNVFWYFNTVTAALDRLRMDGPRAAFKTLFELAEMCGVSRGTAFRIALRRLLRRTGRRWPEDRSFLATGVDAVIRPHDHVWLPLPRDALRGTYAYVQALIQMQDQLEAFDRLDHAPIVAPLLSQPVVEQCLQTASWLWCRSGRNRAVARTAFCDLLPPEVIARQTKGGFEGFSHELLLANRATVRSMLLDGMLAGHGLLDLAQLEAVLDGDKAIPVLVGHRLMRLVAVEAWLQSWRARGWR